MAASTLDECLKSGKSAIECMSISTDKVSPSGKSIVESLVSGEKDPTVSVFQKGREDMLKPILDFFKGFGFLNNKWFWIVVLVILVIIIGKKVLG